MGFFLQPAFACYSTSSLYVVGLFLFFMYFIQPTGDIPYLDQVLDALPSVQMIHIEDQTYMTQPSLQLQMSPIT